MTEPRPGQRYEARRIAAQGEPWSSVELVGARIAAVSYQDVSALISTHLNERPSEPLALDATNTMGVAASGVDPELRAALSAYDLLLPDGMPLLWCLRAKGYPLGDRVYGPYLIEHVLQSLPRRTAVAVIGGAADLHRRLLAEADSRFPRANFVHLDSSAFESASPKETLASLRRAQERNAEVIMVCLGVPKQYHWVRNARPYARGEVLLSVGGAFEFVLGEKRYAPTWMQRYGLTWVYRMFHEPRRLAGRYLKYNSLFVWLLFRHEILPRRMRIGRLMMAIAGGARGARDA